MKKRFFIFFCIFLFLLIAPHALAQTPDGLVPQGCQGGCPCTLCDLYTLGRNIINFLLKAIAVPVAAAMFLYGGVMLLTSGASESQIKKGRDALQAAIVGLAIAFLSYAVINVILGTLAFGVKDAIAPGRWFTPLGCTGAGPDSCELAEGRRALVIEDGLPDDNTPLVPPWPATVATCNKSPGQIAADKRRLAPYDAAIQQAATRYGIPPNRIRAIIMAESGGDPGADSGVALGLMQVKPETAKRHDSGASASKLRDPSYNINMGTKIYADMLNDFGGNPSLASAAYNGGGDPNAGANGPSRDCPGLRRWQCPWDSPGCYQTSRTDCRRNRGQESYEQTREYVPRVNSFEKCFEQ